MDLERLIGQAKQGDLDAFTEVTRRFQHMAFGYALSILRDLQQAEDVVQESFVAAWFGLRTLVGPAACPGWFRGIVRPQAHRLLRQRRLEALPLVAAEAVPAEESGPHDRLEQGQQVAAVLGSIARLPATLREIVILFYVHDCTQQDIATFLGVPVTTVNNRLHAARAQLKRRILTMVKDTLETHQLPDDFAARIGRIVRAREGLVEARFDPLSLPDFLTEIVVSDDARQRAVTLQVVQRLSGGSAGVSLFTLAPWTPVSIADTLRQDGFSEGTMGPVQTFYFRSEEGAWTPERLAGLAGVDVVIRLSAALGGQGIYPTVDPLTSRSRLLEAEDVNRAHPELAARIRAALAPLLASGGDPPAAGE